MSRNLHETIGACRDNINPSRGEVHMGIVALEFSCGELINAEVIP